MTTATPPTESGEEAVLGPADDALPLADDHAPRFADVSVVAPGSRPPGPRGGSGGRTGGRPEYFTYGIPDRLRGRLRQGHVVWVPFGRRRLQGVVIDLHATTALERVRDLERLADGEAHLAPEAVALAHWIAAYYWAPLHTCLTPMLPPGGLGRAVTIFRRTDTPVSANLLDGSRGPEVAKVLALFGRKRQLDEDTIRQAVKRAAGALKTLLDAGVLATESIEHEPRVQAKQQRWLRRVAHDPHATQLALRAMRASTKADVLAFLARADVTLPTPEEISAATGCTAAVLRAMGEADLLTIAPEVRIVQAVVGSYDVEQLAAGELRRAPAQLRLLRTVAAALGPVASAEALDQAAASPAAFSALIERGLLRERVEPAAVSATMRGARLWAAEREARGVQPHHEALEYLSARGGAAAAVEVRRHTRATARTLLDLEAAGLIVSGDRRIWRDPLAGRDDQPEVAPSLTEDQERAWAMIEPLLEREAGSEPSEGESKGEGAGEGAGDSVGEGGGSRSGSRSGSHSHSHGKAGTSAERGRHLRARVALIHGVTGSGKTEIYLRAIARIIDQGRQAIVLVPEIALTPQTVERFAARFPGRVGLWHSALSAGERADTWRRARDGRLAIIVGSRSAVFAPLPSLGLVVVDEEHADAYKQQSVPRYHARDVALELAKLHGATVLLGSATPSIESMWQAERGLWHLVRMPRRVITRSPKASDPVGSAPLSPGEDTGAQGWSRLTADLPPVRIVDMRVELRAGNTSMFSRPLADAIHQGLDDGSQIILFLNRRGSATFVLCRDCGHVMQCPRCELPLTWHHRPGVQRDRGLLRCHHCNHLATPPVLCPACASRRIRYFGVGTERVEEAVNEAFPDARVLRWDADTTTARGSHEAILARFAGGEAEILIGTQMITKGLDLPLVTLVGVISADTALHLPDFRATERAFQLLTQVAGRAGRSDRGGEVIFQTYAPDNPAIVAAAGHDFDAFYAREMEFRRSHGYPPFRRLTRLERFAQRDADGRDAATELAAVLRENIARLGLAETDIIGPAPAYFHRIRDRFRWQVVIRSDNPHALLAASDVPPGWRVDVDPVDLL